MATGGHSIDSNSSAEDPLPVNKLTCAICLEKYRRPKLLPCFHTFCQSCLQSVASSAPSFLCPACRTPVLLPSGGVGALQTNFYIEEDLGTDSSAPPRRLCDVCTEDREATHTCLQCQQRYCAPCRRIHDSCTFGRSHTVVSLQSDDTDDVSCGGAASGYKKKEEMCSKHGDQRVILHCKTCSTNICIQCKLTLHEGHPTEDLSDTGAKAKAELQALLDSMTKEKQRLEGMLSVVDEKCSRLEEQQQTMEQNIQTRVDTLQQWLNQSQDEAVHSVRKSTHDLVTSFRGGTEDLRNKHASLIAQCDHVTRVLRDAKSDADMVSLKTQLSSLKMTGNDPAEKQLYEETPSFTCCHDNTAVNPAMMRAFVGFAKTSHSLTSPQGSDVISQSPRQSDSANIKSSPRELVYSDNERSDLCAICLTRQDQLWVVYSIDDVLNSEIRLLDEQGHCVNDSQENKYCCFRSMVVLDGVFLVTFTTGFFDQVIRWFQPDGKSGTLTENFEPMLSSHASGFNYCCTSRSNGELYRVSVTSVTPWSMTKELVIKKSPCDGSLCDVSAHEKYFAFADGGAAKVFEKRWPADFRLSCSYKPSKTPSDLRFCQIDGKEMLLVVMPEEGKVHVVNYTDGTFVRYLDTSPLTLRKPVRLATDYRKRVWIGCHGGKVVLVDL